MKNTLRLWSIVALALLSLPAFAQEREGIQAQFERLRVEGVAPVDVAGAYVDVTFGSEAASPGSTQAKLIRREGTEPAFIVPWLLPSAIKDETAGQQLYDRLREIAADLDVHADLPLLDVLEPLEVVPFLSRPEAAEDADRTVQIFFGDRSDIAGAVDRYRASAPWIGETYDEFVQDPGLASKQFCGTFVFMSKTRPEALGFALVLIEFGTEMDRCLYRHLLQAFGLLFGTGQGAISIFADDTLRQAPSDLDWLLWRIHTSGLATVGADRDAAFSAVLSALE